MNEPVARVCLLIRHDAALRSAGKTPTWRSEQQILDYIATHRLFQVPEVLEWLQLVAADADLWRSRTILSEIVLPMLDTGHHDNARDIYERVLGLDNVERWQLLGPHLPMHSPLNTPAFEQILMRPSLLANHPETWGATAVRLLPRLVIEHQRLDWPHKLRFHQVLAGGESDTKQPFEVDYDDSPDLWYFAHEEREWGLTLVAQAVEKALREAVVLPTRQTFAAFADRLIAQRFAITIGLVIVVLLDALDKKTGEANWNVDQAYHVLARAEVLEHLSLSALRRLLRIKLPVPPNLAAREAIARAIREATLHQITLCNELADIAHWGVVTDEERQAIAAVQAEGDVYVPSDPREEPIIRTRHTSFPHDHGKELDWPYAEDFPHIESLSKLRPETNVNAPLTEFQRDLMERLEGLQRVLARKESQRPPHFGEVLGWCHRAIEDLRIWGLRQVGPDPDRTSLNAGEWEQLLDKHAPWWRSQVARASGRLREEVPEGHKERQTGGLSWGSADPVFQSLCYLDATLAVKAAGPFGEYHDDLAKAIDDVWDVWPAFTRATALCVLRGMYWRELPKLRARLLTAMLQETSALVLKYAIDRLFQVGGGQIVPSVDQFLRRAESDPSLANHVRRIAIELGHAVVYCSGCDEPPATAYELAAVYGRYRGALPKHPETREQFITGTLAGAKEGLGHHEILTERQATCWLELANWAVGQWPSFGTAQDDNGRFPLVFIWAVLERPWTVEIQRRLHDGLAEGFVRILREGTLGDFSALHFQIREHLRRGDVSPGSPSEAAVPLTQPAKSPLSDELLVRLCRESAERLSRWRAEKKQTNDLGWAGSLTGQDSGDLVRDAFDYGHDRDLLRRELPPIIDLLADAGCTAIASKLRLRLRRG